MPDIPSSRQVLNQIKETVSTQSNILHKLLRQIQHENEKLNTVVIDFKTMVDDAKKLFFKEKNFSQLIYTRVDQFLEELKYENSNLEQISYLIEFQVKKDKKLVKLRQLAAIQNKMLETLLKAQDKQNNTVTYYSSLKRKNSKQELKEFECQKDGLFAERQSNCCSFFVCSWTNTKHSMKSRLKCPNGTFFNQNLGVCDWQKKVNSTC